MEASHPTRDASITRVINAPASHRCTRSLEIGLFNGKACNDPRWRGRNEKECCTLASFLRKKKKLYSFISILASLSFSLYFSMRLVARVKGWKLKSVFFFWGEVEVVLTRVIIFIRCTVRYSVDKSEKLAFNVFNFLIIAMIMMEKRREEGSINRDPLLEKFIRDAFFHGWLRNKVQRQFSPTGIHPVKTDRSSRLQITNEMRERRRLWKMKSSLELMIVKMIANKSRLPREKL